MGKSCCLCLSLSSFNVSDWIDAFGIVVNALLAYWIVRTIQNKLTNKRVLKDHFINEIKEMRSEYKNCLSNLYSGQSNPSRVLPWFKLMNIRVTDVMTLINTKYGIDVHLLKPYQNDLRELVTENADFIDQFKKSAVQFSDKSRNELLLFQQTHNHLFNEIIIEINDAD